MLHPDSRIIGLRGPKRVGKNFTADIIRNLLTSRYAFASAGFADALKEEVALALGVDVADLNGPKKEAFRPMLQWWGTEFRRNMFGEDYWVDKMKMKIQGLEALVPKTPLVVVITDVRFFNEAKLVKDLGGQVWSITSPGFGGGDQHPSEVVMDSYKDYDAVIETLRGLPGYNTNKVNAALHAYGIQTKLNRV